MPESVVIKRSPTRAPSYVRVAGKLQAKIRCGAIGPGDSVPGMRELASEYGVALATVHKAVSLLVTEGTLRANGRGIVVAESDITGTEMPRPPGRAHRSLSASIAVMGPILSGPIGDISDYWPVTMLRGIERALAAEEGVRVKFVNLTSPEGRTWPDIATPEPIIPAHADAVAVFTMGEIDNLVEIVMAQPIASRIPCVFISPYVPSGHVPNVTYDNVAAGFDAARHLIARGYRQLVFVSPYRAIWIEERIVGIRDALAQSRGDRLALRIYIEDILPGVVGQPEAGYALGCAYLSNHDIKKCGLIVSNDNAAYGFRRAAEEASLVAGRDYGLMGFDDRLRSLELGMTSVAPPLELMGAEGGRLLVKMLRGEQTATAIRLRSHLVARNSTATIRG